MKKRLLSLVLALTMCLTLLQYAALAEYGSVERSPIEVSSWAELQAAIDANNDAILSSDITWGGSSLVVPAGKAVTINLNAHSIDAENKGTVIKVYGTLTLTNTGSDGIVGGHNAGADTGNLKNGKTTDLGGAGGVLIASGGKLIMNGGLIYQCTSTSLDGAGGVYVSKGAAFEMNAGSIYQCTGHPAEYTTTASAVVNCGTFTMTGTTSLHPGYSSTDPDNENASSTVLCNAGIMNANSTLSYISMYAAHPDSANVLNLMGTIQTTIDNIKGTAFCVPVINSAGTISGGQYERSVSNSGTISGGTFTGAVDNQPGGRLGTISGGNFQSTVTGKYTVTVTAGANMTVASGSTTQSELLVRDMNQVVVKANDGCYFPADYAVDEQNGVKVTRDSASQVTVSGMPYGNADIKLPDAAAKTKAETPSAAFNAVGSDTGTLTNVDSGMQYSLNNGNTWTDINGSSAELTGLTGNTKIQIIRRGGDTTLDSDIQTITLTQAQTPGASFTAAGTSTGTLNGVSSTMQYKIGSGEWTSISGGSAAITGLSDGSVIHVRTTGGGTVLFSQSQEITVSRANKPAAVFTAADANTGTLSNVTAGMKYKIGDGEISYYASLKDAVEEAKKNSGSTVKLLQDIKAAAYSIVIENCQNSFTVDLNGKTPSTDIDPEAAPGNLVFYLKNNSAPLTLINSASAQAVIKSQRAFHIQNCGSVIIGRQDGSDSNIKFELSAD